MKTIKYSILIIEEEDLTRERIKNFLGENRHFTVIAEAKNGKEAVLLIEKFKPQLIFLDIHMLGLKGLDVVSKLTTVKPEIIFITTFDNYVIDAFEIHAVDYLLKPFTELRFNKSLSRAKSKLKSKTKFDYTSLVDEILKIKKEENNYIKKIAIKDNGAIKTIPIEDIIYIESAGNYITYHTTAKKILHRDSVSHIGEMLNPSEFTRVHRSYIVNNKFIKELYPRFTGEYIIIMQNGSKVPTGKKFKNNVTNLFSTK